MDSLYREAGQLSEERFTVMTEDVSIGMKPPHRDLFINVWKDLVKEKILKKESGP